MLLLSETHKNGGGWGNRFPFFFLGNYPEFEILALVIQHSLKGFIDGDSMVANDLGHTS